MRKELGRGKLIYFMFKIDDIQLKIIKDSREEDTLEAKMISGSFEAVSSVPKGKSRGAREASSLNPQEALDKFRQIKPKLLKQEYGSIFDFDNFLIKLTGASNLTLVLSQTFSRLISKILSLELWQYLREELLIIAPELKKQLLKYRSPYFLFNVINGGAHAPYGPKIQEYLLIPKIDNPKVSLEIAEIFFAGLKEYFLKEYGNNKFGDEGGLLISEINYEKPLEIMTEVQHELRLEKNVSFGLDVAATNFYIRANNSYSLWLDQDILANNLLDIYLDFKKKYHLFSLEDPFEENDFINFTKLTRICGREPIIIGDDLTTTNPIFITKAIENKSISGVIIKPTQIGTISATLQAIALAQKNNIKVIISHRSAETLDDFIADLAFASGAFGLKAGAPQPEERMVKYERVIEIINKIKN